MSLREAASVVWQPFGCNELAGRPKPWFANTSRWLFLCLLLPACGIASKPSEAPSSRHSYIKTILVVPFEHVNPGVGSGESVYCPVCNAAFEAGPIASGAEQYMTKQLMEFLKRKTAYRLIPPEASKGVRSEVISKDIAIPYRCLLTEMGKTLQADGVLSGVIWRFRQRIGTVLSVELPASVGFGVHLIRVVDGRLLWSRHFDETQQTLSEDLFKLKAFVERGGGWLSAEELATAGLTEVMSNFPVP